VFKGLLFIALSGPGLANAHVKWFATSWDPAGAQVSLGALLSSPAFVALLGLTIAVTAAVRILDRRLSAAPMVRRWQDDADRMTKPRVASILRGGLAVYFISIALYFASDPIILTPELKTHLWWMPVVQLAIGMGLLVRPGVLPACALIAVLYGYAAHVHGWVHMLDYHFFLGVLALLALDARHGQRRARLGLLLLRVTVATSFLWVAVEKWFYPDWTHEILATLIPPLLPAFDVHFTCIAAGYVEFGLAFFILFGRASSQIAALVLLSLVLAAIPLVGPVDAIGHLPLAVPLAILAATRNRWRRRAVNRQAPARAAGAFLFPSTFVALLLLYFLSHELAAAASGFGDWHATLLHAAFAGAAGYWGSHAFHVMMAGRRGSTG